MGEENFRIHHIAPYVLGEIAQAVIAERSAGRDVIDLSQVNPNLGPPAEAVDSLVQSVLRPHNHRYSSSQGISKLRRAVADWYQSRFAVELDFESEVVVTMGTKEGLAHLLLAVLSPGENVLVPVPVYPIHSAAVFIAGAGFIGVPLFDEGEEVTVLSEASAGFFERLESFYNQTWPRPRMLVCSFPHNPTTTIVEQSFFERLVAFARERQLYIVHDFAYADICFGKYRAPSVLSVPGAKDLAVEFYSLSKGFNMPGWRLAFCVGNPQLVAALKKMKSYLDSGIFQPLQIAALQALEKAERNLPETVHIYESRRNVLVSGLRQLGWDIHEPQATVFLWAKIPSFYGNTQSLEFCKRLLEHSHVALCPGAGFGLQGDAHVRFALVENESRLRTALQGLAQLRGAA